MSQASGEYDIVIAAKGFDPASPLNNIKSDAASCFPSALCVPFKDYITNVAQGDYDILTKEQCMDTTTIVPNTRNHILKPTKPLRIFGPCHNSQRNSTQSPLAIQHPSPYIHDPPLVRFKEYHLHPGILLQRA